MMETHGAGGGWEYPRVVAVMDAAVLHPIREYIRRRQATIAEKVAFRTIYELCVKGKRVPRMIRMVIL